jgi:hypothetical protein
LVPRAVMRVRGKAWGAVPAAGRMTAEGCSWWRVGRGSRATARGCAPAAQVAPPVREMERP